MAVRGLDLFRNHFRAFPDHYVLIGGSACSILLDAEGITPRATKDLDLVFVAEVSLPFYQAIKDFLRQGGYEPGEMRTKKKAVYYRFLKPKNGAFPSQIEILSKKVIPALEGQVAAPLKVEGVLASLSAILLDDDYYELIMGNRIIIDEISLVPAKVLIPLKAKAWMNLTEKEKAAPGSIHSTDIRKHIADIFLLQEILAIDDRIVLTDLIKRDLDKAFRMLPGDPATQRQTGYAEKLEMMKRFFGG